jgi:alkylation response protein AidB-like acyl-CoA dehydrogenase
VTEDGFNEQQLLLAESVQRYVRERCTPDQRRSWQEGHGSPEVWTEIAELGWLGVIVGEDDGGFGGCGIDMAIVAMGIGEGLISEPFLPTAVVAATIFSASPAAKSRLAELIDGKLRIAFADSEFGQSYGGQSKAMLTKASGGFALSGMKSLVIGSAKADAILVTATHQESGQPVILQIETDRQEVRSQFFKLVDGRPAADLEFVDLPIDAHAILVEGDTAVKALELARARGAVANAAETVGVMRGVLQATREHLSARHQFGVPLSSFQVLQHRFADMVIELEQAESATLAAARALDSRNVAERFYMGSIAKVRTMKAGRLVGENAVQLHGGMGVTAECAVGQYYKRLLVLETLFGDPTYHLDRIAAGF